MAACDLVVVTTTFATREQAIEMATRATQARVAACAQVDGPLESFYEWEGKTCQETE
jgi:periplasmic divalent cation tolerance protein